MDSARHEKWLSLFVLSMIVRSLDPKRLSALIAVAT